MVNQQVRTRTNFVVDVNGYRAKRAESLRKLALRMADQVNESGRTVALEPMPPAERRIIHLALREHPTVITQSIGEGRPAQGHHRAEEELGLTPSSLGHRAPNAGFCQGPAFSLTHPPRCVRIRHDHH